MAQQIIVYIIGVLIAVYIGISVYRMVTRRKDPCAGCAGCSLKSELDSKRAGCREQKQYEQEIKPE